MPAKPRVRHETEKPRVLSIPVDMDGVELLARAMSPDSWQLGAHYARRYAALEQAEEVLKRLEAAALRRGLK